MFAIPAMYMCYWGFMTPGWFGTISYASGLGITIYGKISYTRIKIYITKFKKKYLRDSARLK